jgi:glycerol-3-phosphate acyltransferase PlsY
MGEYGLIFAVWLLILFLPFLISLSGTMTFAFMAFVGNCAAVWVALMSLAEGLASRPPNPPEDAKQAILFWSFWLTAWVFSLIGIWRKRRKRARLLQPVRRLYRMAYRERLRGKDYAYFDGQDR